MFKPGFQAAEYLTDLMGMWFILLVPFNINISVWDVCKVSDITDILKDADGFEQDLNTWNVCSVGIEAVKITIKIGNNKLKYGF